MVPDSSDSAKTGTPNARKDAGFMVFSSLLFRDATLIPEHCQSVRRVRARRVDTCLQRIVELLSTVRVLFGENGAEHRFLDVRLVKAGGRLDEGIRAAAFQLR